MPLAIIPLQPEHVPVISKICFDAFGSLQDRHGVERDFTSAAEAEMMIGHLASRPDTAGLVAVEQSSGRNEVIGSNFLMFADSVAGVGPITVRPDCQGKGVGALLMSAILAEAARRGIAQVRLFQEAINTASLSLYSKLGFEWRTAAALMRPAPPAPDEPDDPRIEPITLDHLPIIDQLSARGYHDSRVNEAAALLRHGFPGFVLIREEVAGQRIVGGYHFPGMFGHGFAATPEDMVALIRHGARHAPPMFRKVIVPLSQHELHTRLLAAGCTTIKLFNYMSVGQYTPPVGTWIPTIGM